MRFSEFSYLRHYGEFIDTLLNNIDDGADEVLLEKFLRARKGLRIKRRYYGEDLCRVRGYVSPT